MPELPPVVASIILDYEQLDAGISSVEDRMGALTGSLDDSLEGFDRLSASSDAAGDALDRVAGAADTANAALDTDAEGADASSAAMDRVAESANAAGDSMDRMAASSDASRDSMADVAAGAAVMGSGVSDAGEDLRDAEDDAEEHTGGFSSRVQGLFEKVGETMGNFGIPFHGAVSKMGEDIGEAEGHGEGFKAAVESVGKVLTVVGAGAVAGFAAESVHMADEFDVAQGQLQNAIKDTGGSLDAVKPQIEDTYSRMAHLGFENTEVAKSLQSLTISTKSPTVAMQDMSVAADLARAKNMSLESATAMLTKVYAGSTRALTTLGLNLDVGTGKLKSIQSATESVKSAELAEKTVQDEVNSGKITGVEADDKLAAAHLKLEQAETKLRMDQQATGTILDTVKQRTEGAANAYGHTLAGQMKVAGAEVHNLGVSFGEMLMPAITATVGVLSEVVSWFIEGSTAAHVLEAVIGGPLAAAMAVYIAKTVAAGVASAYTWVTSSAEAVAGAAMQVGSWIAVGAAATAAFIAENLATLGIIAAIGLLIAGIVMLATHWSEVWHAIESVVTTVANAIVGALAAAWDEMRGAAEAVWDAIKTVAEEDWHDIQATAETVWSAIKGAAERIWQGIKIAIETPVHLARQLAEEAWHQIQTTAEAVWGAIVNFIRGIPAKISSALSTLASTVEKVASEAWSGFLHVVEKVGGEAVRFVEGLPGGFVKGLASLAGDLLKIGEQALKELLKGLENAAKAVLGWLGGFAKDVVGVVKSVLGVFSPSSVFADVGKSLMEGLAKGVKDHAALVTGSGGALGGVAQEIMAFFESHGLSAIAASGIVGNVAQESSFNPNAPGGGLFQTIGGRGVAQGSSVMAQLESAWKEMVARGEIGRLQGARTPQEAASIFGHEFERPEEGPTANYPHREQAAAEAYGKYGGAQQVTFNTTINSNAQASPQLINELWGHIRPYMQGAA